MATRPDTLDRSLFSLIVPVYNEEENLPELARRLGELFDALDFDACEAVLVSDGSVDGSEAIIRELVAADRRFRGVFLTRNFGHQAAVSVGMRYARGSVIGVVDADLQDPPEALPKLIAALKAGADVAYGVRRRRKEGWTWRAAYWLFYRTMAATSRLAMPLDAGDFCVMTRRVVEAVNSLPESRRFVRGLRAWVGYRQVGVEYERQARWAGRPKYGLRMLIRLAYDGLFSFSDVPVKLMQILGFLISAIALLVGAGYFVSTFLVSTPWGFPTLIISIWLLAGVQMFFLGLLGEYMHRTYEQSLGRPAAMVREVVGSAGDADPT